MRWLTARSPASSWCTEWFLHGAAGPPLGHVLTWERALRSCSAAGWVCPASSRSAEPRPVALVEGLLRSANNSRVHPSSTCPHSARSVQSFVPHHPPPESACRVRWHAAASLHSSPPRGSPLPAALL